MGYWLEVALVAGVPVDTAEVVAAGIADVGECAAPGVAALLDAGVAGGASEAGPLAGEWVLASWQAGPLELAAGVAVVYSQNLAYRFAHYS